MTSAATRIAALALLFLAWPALADDSGFGCLRDFLAKLRQRQGIQFEAVDLKPGGHGGTLIEIKERPPDSFYVPAKIARNSPERRPSQLIAVIADSKIARFFGFEHLSEGRYLIPDQPELEGAIRAFNSLPGVEGTEQAIRVRFYDPPTSTEPRLYIKTLADDGALPIAQKGHYFVHDITVHAGGAVFLPNSFLQATRLQMRELLSFESWLSHSAPDVYRHINFKKIFELEAERIDFAQGDLLEALRNSAGGVHEPLTNAVNRFTGWGKPPDEFMKELFERYPGMLPKKTELDSAFSRFVRERAPSETATPFPKAEDLTPETLEKRIRFISEKLQGATH